MKLTGLKPLILVALALMIDDAKAIISSQSEDIWREHFLQSPTKAPQVPIASFTQNGYIQVSAFEAPRSQSKSAFLFN